MTNNVRTYSLSEPLNGATTAKVDINSGTGNLTVDRIAGGEQLLASGSLQYVEDQGLPTRTLDSSNGQAVLTLKSGDTKRAWFHFPWATCLTATDWQIHINPTVSSDITAHSGGGNIVLDLTGMVITRAAADTGGGNITMVLPDGAAEFRVAARTGAGNVTVEIGGGVQGTGVVEARSGAGNVIVRIPSDVAARIHATSGLGKVTVDQRFSKTDKNTYQSPDYDSAASWVDITLKTGAGNVSVSSR